jgi:hypothetical protein
MSRLSIFTILQYYLHVTSNTKSTKGALYDRYPLLQGPIILKSEQMAKRHKRS